MPSAVSEALGLPEDKPTQTRIARALGLLSETWPAKMARSAYDAIALPGDVAGGRFATEPVVSGQWSDEDEARAQANQRVMDNRATDLAGLVMGGSYAAAPAMKDASGMGIRAYHGSPHDFDRFDMSKIGTGEGAQVFGRGLYYAENEAVARGYRDTLAKDAFRTADGRLFDPSTLEHLNVRSLANRSGGDLDVPIAKAREIVESASPGPTKAMAIRDLERLEALKAQGGVTPNLGRMYEVDIKAKPQDMLDWDAPLTKQPAAVKRALNEMGVNADAPPLYRLEPTESGKSQYLIHPGGWVTRGNPGPFRNPQKAQAALDAANEQHLATDWNGGVGHDRALKKFYPKHHSAAAAEMVANSFREAGVPGVRYLDQRSRGAGDGSRNYVVFDDSLVSILRKYGLAGVPAGGVAAALSNTSEQDKL